MKIRHNDIEINTENPFQNCRLAREPYAVVLTELIKNFNDGFVLAIDSEWGTGKTTFVKMWKQHLENENENDILVTLISELEELKSSKNEAAFKTMLSKAAPLAKTLALGFIKTQVEKYVGNDFAKELLSDCNKINYHSNMEKLCNSIRHGILF